MIHFCIEFGSYVSLADPRGALGYSPPLGPISSIFMLSLAKVCQILGWHPPWGWYPPLWNPGSATDDFPKYKKCYHLIISSWDGDRKRHKGEVVLRSAGLRTGDGDGGQNLQSREELRASGRSDRYHWQREVQVSGSSVPAFIHRCVLQSCCKTTSVVTCKLQSFFVLTKNTITTGIVSYSWKFYSVRFSTYDLFTLSFQRQGQRTSVTVPISLCRWR